MTIFINFSGYSLLDEKSIELHLGYGNILGFHRSFHAGFLAHFPDFAHRGDLNTKLLRFLADFHGQRQLLVLKLDNLVDFSARTLIKETANNILISYNLPRKLSLDNINITLAPISSNT